MSVKGVYKYTFHYTQRTIKTRAVVIYDKSFDCYYGQCIDYWICSQADSVENAELKLYEAMRLNFDDPEWKVGEKHPNKRILPPLDLVLLYIWGQIKIRIMGSKDIRTLHTRRTQ